MDYIPSKRLLFREEAKMGICLSDVQEASVLAAVLLLLLVLAATDPSSFKRIATSLLLKNGSGS